MIWKFRTNSWLSEYMETYEYVASWIRAPPYLFPPLCMGYM